jgi:hypothetical protein
MVFKKILTCWPIDQDIQPIHDLNSSIEEEDFESIATDLNDISDTEENFLLSLWDEIRNRFFDGFNWLIDHRVFFNFNWGIFNRSSFKSFKRSFSIFFFRRSFRLIKSNFFKKIKDIVLWKKKTSFLKKNNKLELSFLKRMHMFKFKKSIFDRPVRRKRRKHMFSKIIDLHKRTNLIWYYNRRFFKKFLKIPSIRQWNLSRFFSNFLKSSPLDFIKFWDDSLLNLMLLARLVPSFKEAMFLSQSGLIFINGIEQKFHRTAIRLGDVIQLGISDLFYKFYRWNIHFKQRLFKRVGYHLWLLNRFRFNFYKQSTKRIPDFIDNIMFFYEDTPRFLELDFLTLTFVVVLRKDKFKFFNFFFKKVPALNMSRLYNWKYIV